MNKEQEKRTATEAERKSAKPGDKRPDKEQERKAKSEAARAAAGKGKHATQR